MAKLFKVGDKVKFKSDYKGYFAPEAKSIGVFTVDWVGPNDEKTWQGKPDGGAQYIKLKELKDQDEHHLLKSGGLVLAFNPKVVTKPSRSRQFRLFEDPEEQVWEGDSKLLHEEYTLVLKNEDASYDIYKIWHDRGKQYAEIEEIKLNSPSPYQPGPKEEMWEDYNFADHVAETDLIRLIYETADPSGETDLYGDGGDVSESKMTEAAGKKWIIQDWAGNYPFGDKKFKDFDSADEYLTLWIEKKYPKTKDDEKAFSEERGEYEIVEAGIATASFSLKVSDFSDDSVKIDLPLDMTISEMTNLFEYLDGRTQVPFSVEDDGYVRIETKDAGEIESIKKALEQYVANKGVQTHSTTKGQDFTQKMNKYKHLAKQVDKDSFSALQIGAWVFDPSKFELVSFQLAGVGGSNLTKYALVNYEEKLMLPIKEEKDKKYAENLHLYFDDNNIDLAKERFQKYQNKFKFTKASSDDTQSAVVVFKKFPEGDVIALFPYEVADPSGNIMSYMHIGQHGAASPELVQELEDATPAEYGNLQKELERIGYELDIVDAKEVEAAAVEAATDPEADKLKKLWEMNKKAQELIKNDKMDEAKKLMEEIDKLHNEVYDITNLKKTESTATPEVAVPNVSKNFKGLVKHFNDSGLQLDFTNPSMHWSFTVEGHPDETFSLNLMDGWVTVDHGPHSSSTGSALNDKKGYDRLVKAIKQQVGMSEFVTATGEPDQEYDHAFFDALCAKIEAEGFKCRHKEFDKYQGVYLKVFKNGKEVTTFWIKDFYQTGKRGSHDTYYEYSDAYMIDAEGNETSANPSDYFMMGPDEVFEGSTLILIPELGPSKELENPKKSDLPKEGEVKPKTFQFVGIPDDHYIFYPEQHEDESVEVIVPKGDASKIQPIEMIEWIKAMAEEVGVEASVITAKLPARIAKAASPVDVEELELLYKEYRSVAKKLKKINSRFEGNFGSVPLKMSLMPSEILLFSYDVEKMKSELRDQLSKKALEEAEEKGGMKG